MAQAQHQQAAGRNQMRGDAMFPAGTAMTRNGATASSLPASEIAREAAAA